MDKEFLQDIKQILESFNDSLKIHLPPLEKEVDKIISSDNNDCKLIENTLDNLLSLTMHGIGNDIFIKLLNYYKTINAKGAKFYWNEYENQNE